MDRILKLLKRIKVHYDVTAYSLAWPRFFLSLRRVDPRPNFRLKLANSFGLSEHYDMINQVSLTLFYIYQGTLILT